MSLNFSRGSRDKLNKLNASVRTDSKPFKTISRGRVSTVSLHPEETMSVKVNRASSHGQVSTPPSLPILRLSTSFVDINKSIIKHWKNPFELPKIFLAPLRSNFRTPQNKQFRSWSKHKLQIVSLSRVSVEQFLSICWNSLLKRKHSD